MAPRVVRLMDGCSREERQGSWCAPLVIFASFEETDKSSDWFTSVSIHPASLRASHGGSSQRGLSALRMRLRRRRGQTERSERGSSRSVARAREDRTKKKTFVGERLVRSASSAAETHLGLFFQPDVAVLEQPVEVVRAHGFRFPLVRVVHEVLHAAHRRDGAHDDGERREGLERLRLVFSRDDGATECRRRGGKARGQRGGGIRSGFGRRCVPCARASEDATSPRRVVVARVSAPRPSRGCSARRRGVPCAVLFRLARRGGGVGARSDASIRLRGSVACERRDHRSTSDVRDAARLGMTRGSDRENKHGQTVIEGKSPKSGASLSPTLGSRGGRERVSCHTLREFD